MLPLSEKELDELVALERARGEPPLTNWDSIASELRSQGIIRQQPFMSRFNSRSWMQIAAALALVAGGLAIGRYTAKPNQSTVAASSPAPASPIAGNTTAQNVSNTAAATAAEFKSADEAWEVLNRAGEEYQRASAYLSASNTEVPMPTNPSQYRTRLAALDGVMTEIRGALKEAPEDPVINQYYLATVGAREATLRQLGTTLRPAGVSLNRF
jgi:hypothetical protein